MNLHINKMNGQQYIKKNKKYNFLHYHRNIINKLSETRVAPFVDIQKAYKKGKAIPLKALLSPRGWVEVHFFPSMTEALEERERLAANAGHTLPPWKTRYPMYRRLSGIQKPYILVLYGTNISEQECGDPLKACSTFQEHNIQ